MVSASVTSEAEGNLSSRSEAGSVDGVRDMLVPKRAEMSRSAPAVTV